MCKHGIIPACPPANMFIHAAMFYVLTLVVRIHRTTNESADLLVAFKVYNFIPSFQFQMSNATI